MGIDKTLNVEKRNERGKGASGRLRSKDMVPGIFYTSSGKNLMVQVPSLPLEKLYDEVGHTTVFNLEINDNGKTETHPVLIWQVQRHPYKKLFLHIDYYGVDLDKEIKVDVPIEFVGVPHGVKLGGILETYRESVQLTSKPLEMPQKITIDVTPLNINDSIAVADLQLPAGVHAVYDHNFAIASVLEKGKEDAQADGDAAGAE